MRVGQHVELEEAVEVDGDAEVDEALRGPALPSFGGVTWRPRLPFRILGLLAIVGSFRGKIDSILSSQSLVDVLSSQSLIDVLSSQSLIDILIGRLDGDF